MGVHMVEQGWTQCTHVTLSSITLTHDACLQVFLSQCEYRVSESGGVNCLDLLSVTPTCLRIAVGLLEGSVVIHEYQSDTGDCTHITSIGMEFIPQALEFERGSPTLLVVGKANGKL
jgi:hypothetical protein